MQAHIPIHLDDTDTVKLSEVTDAVIVGDVGGSLVHIYPESPEQADRMAEAFAERARRMREAPRQGPALEVARG